MRTLGMLLKGDAPEIRDREGRHATDDNFMLLLNSHSDPVEFNLPEGVAAWGWKVAFDTARPDLAVGTEAIQNSCVKMAARSFVVLVYPKAAPAG